jgi:hypothetical protein
LSVSALALPESPLKDAHGASRGQKESNYERTS